MIFKTFQSRLKIFCLLLKKGLFLKAANYFLTAFSMVLKPAYCLNRPSTIIVDPFNRCNLACRLCVTGQKKNQRPKTMLELEDYQKILAQLGPLAVFLDLYNWGEPLLHPQLPRMISLAKKYRLHVTTSSNLLLLNQRLARAITLSGLDELIISLHGATSQTVNTYMRGNNFSKVIKNIKLLLKTRRQLKSATPYLIWRFVAHRQNEKEIPLAKKLARKIGVDKFEVLPAEIDVGFSPSKNRLANQRQKNWLAQTVQPLPANCHWPWEITSIQSDGAIQPCCRYESPRFDFGNLLQKPFEKIWNGPKYRLARQILRRRNIYSSHLCSLCLKSGL